MSKVQGNKVQGRCSRHGVYDNWDLGLKYRYKISDNFQPFLLFVHSHHVTNGRGEEMISEKEGGDLYEMTRLIIDDKTFTTIPATTCYWPLILCMGFLSIQSNIIPSTTQQVDTHHSRATVHTMV
jgi:hypothetical protein